MAPYSRVVDDLKSPVGWLPVQRDQLWAQCLVTSIWSLFNVTDCQKQLPDVLYGTNSQSATFKHVLKTHFLNQCFTFSYFHFLLAVFVLPSWSGLWSGSKLTNWCMVCMYVTAILCSMNIDTKPEDCLRHLSIYVNAYAISSACCDLDVWPPKSNQVISSQHSTRLCTKEFLQVLRGHFCWSFTEGKTELCTNATT